MKQAYLNTSSVARGSYV